MTDYILPVVNIIVICLSFFCGILLIDNKKFIKKEPFQYKGRLFFITLTSFGIIKAIRLFAPYYPQPQLYLTISAVLPAILGLLHLIIRRNASLIYKIILSIAIVLPLINIVHNSTSITFLSLAIISGTCFFYQDERKSILERQGLQFLPVTGALLLFFLGGEFLLSDFAPKFTAIFVLLELILILLSLTYTFKHLFSENLKLQFYIFLFIIFCSGISAFYLIQYFTLNYERQCFKDVRAELKIIRERITKFNDRCFRELKLLASHPVVKNALILKSKSWPQLSSLQMALGAEAIYILDKKGNVISSSNASFIGKNFSFRPYFKKAIKGESNFYFARGIITNRVGSYFARPIVGENGAISHVLVMKIPFENIISREFSASGILMINSDGGVLLGPSNMTDHTLFNIGPEQLEFLEKSKIFGNVKLSSLNFKRITPEHIIDNKGVQYLFVTLPLYNGQWTLARLVPYKKILQRTGIFIAAYFALLSSFILQTLIYFYNKEWIIKLNKEVSLRKRAEGLQFLLTSIIEKGTEGVIITDENGVIEYTNPAISEITGYSRKELLGKNIRLLKNIAPAQIFSSPNTLLQKTGKSWHERMTNKRKDGTFYEADVIIFPLLTETNQQKYVLIQKDITNELQLQRQLLQAQKMEAIGTLAGGVAHDFNNLLTALQGYAEIGSIKLGPDSPVNKYFQQIQSICNRAAQLVKQLLIFSRQEASEKVRLNLNNTIEDLLKMLNRLIGENIRITLKLSPGLPDIHADRVNIEQILVNLIVNAKDAMPNGGEITIETSVIDISEEMAQNLPNARSGKYVRLSVEDSGEGIPRDIVEKIFDPFFTTKAPGKGTGLGLSVVYSIVKQHGGWVNVYSELSRGTVFKIYFPIVQNADQESTVQSDEISKDFDGQGKIILFIEDEINVRNIGEEYLKNLNFEVLLAKDIKEAQKLYNEHWKNISIIISDLMLPDGNGFEFIKELKPTCPVIFCTGYINQLDIKTEIKKLGYYFIQKPYSEKDLVGILSTALHL